MKVVKAYLELFEAALKADYTAIRRSGNNAVRVFEDLQEGGSAQKLRALLRKKSVPLKASGYSEQLPVDGKSRSPLLEELDWPEAPIFLSKDNSELFSVFINEVKNSQKLSKVGLATKPRLMLSGPPGTGKTLMATHVAAQLSMPIYVVRLDSLISSFLGETAKNIRAIFEYISTQNAVLLIDEIDAVAKMRDDRHELGELKRVVNTLIQGLDSMDEHAVVVAATNHANLLDPAIWRRFPYTAEIPLPDKGLREALWGFYLFQDKQPDTISVEVLSVASHDMSCAEIMESALAERRRATLEENVIDVVKTILAIIRTRNKRLSSFSSPGKVQSSDKKEISRYLVGSNIKVQTVADILKVSRQTVSKYIKES